MSSEKTVPSKKLFLSPPRAPMTGAVDTKLNVLPPSSSNISLSTKVNIKQLQRWFSKWHQWQKRTALCRVIEHCSVSHLKTLSTALEPTLHLDFASTLTPLMAALHIEGSQTFKIQRAADKRKQMTSARIISLLNPTRPPSNVPAKAENGGSRISRETKELSSSPPQIFLPSLPQSHLKHKPSVASSDINQAASQKQLSLPPISIERKFYSVPNLHLTSLNTLYTAKQNLKAKRQYRSLKNEMLLRRNEYNQTREIELYKNQLSMISKWMTESSPKEIACILLELIRLCNEELLGYLVQCVYQKLQTQRGIDSLSDDLLLKIFSYLDAPNLCRCARVCHRWYGLTYNSKLWRNLCLHVTRREGLGDVVHAIEAVQKMSISRPNNKGTKAESNADEPSGVVVDWKQAYRDLMKLMSKLKSMILKRAVLLEIEKQRKEEQRLRSLTSSQFRSSLSLREMLDMARVSSGRFSKGSTTRDILMSAPESPMAKRRRERKETHVQLSKSTTINEMGTEFTDNDTFKQVRKLQRSSTTCCINLVEAAIDSRPSVPSLPNPEGIKALVLGGFLSPQDRPRPGKAEPIPLVRRLPYCGTYVLCMQCDERKIVAGCGDRLIRVYDIRSGRLVSTLSGHKGSVQCLQFDDYKIVSGSWDTTCIVWDIVNFEQLLTLAGHTDCVVCLEFCNETLVTGCYDKTIKIWDIESWSCIRTIPSAHSRIITCLTFNGFTIISGSEDRTVKVWDVSTGKCQATLGHASRVTSLRLSKLLLVTATGDGSVNLWDLTGTNTSLMRYDIGAGNCIVDIAISKGKIYIGGSDGVLYEWDISTGACVRTLTGHKMPLTTIWVGEFKILTASEDQSLSVWYINKLLTETTGDDHQTDTFYSDVPIRVIKLS